MKFKRMKRVVASAVMFVLFATAIPMPVLAKSELPEILIDSKDVIDTTGSIKIIEGYDGEKDDIIVIPEGEGRMDNISTLQRSKNAAVFCKVIEDAGYDSMIYCNMYYEAYMLDLEMLSGFPIWYADYNRYPQTPYHFDIWQYTSKGKVDGIDGNVDLNIQMITR